MRTPKYIQRFFLTLLLSSVGGMTATQAANGPPGVNSIPFGQINIQSGKMILVKNLSDYSFGNWSGVGDLDSTQGFSISVSYGKNPNNRRYDIVASGSGAAGAFTLVNGSAQTIAYQAFFTGGGKTAEMISGTSINNTKGANHPTGDNTLNVSLRILIPEANLNTAAGGTYSGTITLTASPR